MVAIWFLNFFENYVLKISEANSLNFFSIELVAMSPLNKPDNCQGVNSWYPPNIGKKMKQGEKKIKKGKQLWLMIFIYLFLDLLLNILLLLNKSRRKTQNDQNDMYVTLKLQKNLAMTNDKGGWSYFPSKKKIEEISDFGYLPTAWWLDMYVAFLYCKMIFKWHTHPRFLL